MVVWHCTLNLCLHLEQQRWKLNQDGTTGTFYHLNHYVAIFERLWLKYFIFVSKNLRIIMISFLMRKFLLDLWNWTNLIKFFHKTEALKIFLSCLICLALKDPGFWENYFGRNEVCLFWLFFQIKMKAFYVIA